MWRQLFCFKGWFSFICTVTHIGVELTLIEKSVSDDVWCQCRGQERAELFARCLCLCVLSPGETTGENQGPKSVCLSAQGLLGEPFQKCIEIVKVVWVGSHG